MGNNEESRRLRREANDQRRWQVILRATVIGAYCVVLVSAGLYLGYKGREVPEPSLPAILQTERPVTTPASGEQSYEPTPADTSESASTVNDAPIVVAPAEGLSDVTAASQEGASDETASITEPTASTGAAATTTGTESGADATASTEALVLPVSGKVVTGPRWVFSEYYNEWRYMPGVDLGTQPGDVVKAAMTGSVVSVHDDPLLGTVLILDHENGLVTEYGRLSECMLGVGDKVNQGDPLGFAQSGTVYFGASKDGYAVSVGE